MSERLHVMWQAGGPRTLFWVSLLLLVLLVLVDVFNGGVNKVTWVAEFFVIFTCGWFWGKELYRYWREGR